MVIRIKEGRGRPRSDDPLEKVTIVLRAGDPEWIQIMNGPRSLSKTIRKLVSDYVDREQTPEPMDLDTTISALKEE